MIVTGLSGAGKVEALRALEDIGFIASITCLRIFAQVRRVCSQTGTSQRGGPGIDLRGGDFFSLFAALEDLEREGFDYNSVSEAQEDVLMSVSKDAPPASWRCRAGWMESAWTGTPAGIARPGRS